MVRRLWVCIVSMVTVVGSGCGDECDPDTFTAFCEGNVTVTCPGPGPDPIVGTRIHRNDCEARSCVAIGSTAICALSAEPTALCADAGTSVCETAQSQVHCSAGYETARVPCLACVTSDAGTVVCEGGPSWGCSDASHCAQGLTCSDHGFCITR